MLLGPGCQPQKGARDSVAAAAVVVSQTLHPNMLRYPQYSRFLCTGTNKFLNLLASEPYIYTYQFSIHISYKTIQFKCSSH